MYETGLTGTRRESELGVRAVTLGREEDLPDHRFEHSRQGAALAEGAVCHAPQSVRPASAPAAAAHALC